MHLPHLPSLCTSSLSPSVRMQRHMRCNHWKSKTELLIRDRCISTIQYNNMRNYSAPESSLNLIKTNEFCSTVIVMHKVSWHQVKSDDLSAHEYPGDTYTNRRKGAFMVWSCCVVLAVSLQINQQFNIVSKWI